MADYELKGGTLQCECGRKYHVSLFHPVLRVIAEAAYRRGQQQPGDPVQESIEVGYAYGRDVASGAPKEGEG